MVKRVCQTSRMMEYIWASQIEVLKVRLLKGMSNLESEMDGLDIC